MYTIFSVVQRQQRKSDVMTYFGLTACSAVYYQVPYWRFLIRPVHVRHKRLNRRYFTILKRV
jgi:hypothetical protein